MGILTRSITTAALSAAVLLLSNAHAQGCSNTTKAIINCVVAGVVAEFASVPGSQSCTGADLCAKIRNADSAQLAKWASDGTACGTVASTPRGVDDAVLMAFGCAVDSSSANGVDLATPGLLFRAACEAHSFGQTAIQTMLGESACYIAETTDRAIRGNLSRNVYKGYPNHFGIPIQEHQACINNAGNLGGLVTINRNGKCGSRNYEPTHFLVPVQNDAADTPIVKQNEVSVIRNTGTCGQVDAAGIDDWRLEADLCASLSELHPVRGALDSARYQRCNWVATEVDYRWLEESKLADGTLSIVGQPGVDVKGQCVSSITSPRHISYRAPLPGGGSQIVHQPLIIGSETGWSAELAQRGLELYKRGERYAKLRTQAQLDQQRGFSGRIYSNRRRADYTIISSLNKYYINTIRIGGELSYPGQPLTYAETGPISLNRKNWIQFDNSSHGVDIPFEPYVGKAKKVEVLNAVIWEAAARPAPPCYVTIETNQLYYTEEYDLSVDGKLGRYVYRNGSPNNESPAGPVILSLVQMATREDNRYVYEADKPLGPGVRCGG